MTLPHLFIPYFDRACKEVLSDERRRMVALRYGIESGVPLTFQAVGTYYGLPRERIHRLIMEALRRIRARGARQLSTGKKDAPCARLLSYLAEALTPWREGVYERLGPFIAREVPTLSFSSAIARLIAYLLHLDHPTVIYSTSP